MVGSGIYPQYDMTKFVRLSMEIGMPIIGVTLKYVALLLGNSFVVLLTDLKLPSRCSWLLDILSHARERLQAQQWSQ